MSELEEIRVTILDTLTGSKSSVQTGWEKGWWTDGNGSCDCNRSIFMGVERYQDSSECLGAKRFLVVEVNGCSELLREFNQDYPAELLEKHGIS